MINKLLLSGLVATASATSGLAQGFTGAEMGLEFNTFDEFDLSVTKYYGGAEFAFAQQFAVAADVSLYSNSEEDGSANNITFHGIYKFGPSRSGAGVFFGQDSIDDDDLTVFGVEAAYNYGQGNIEGFFGVGEPETGDSDISFIGGEFEYDLGNGLGVVGGFDRFDLSNDSDEVTITTVEIGGSYEVAQMVSVFAKIGQVGLDADTTTAVGTDDDVFVGIGAEIGFGPDQGMTFSPRSIGTNGFTF